MACGSMHNVRGKVPLKKLRRSQPRDHSRHLEYFPRQKTIGGEVQPRLKANHKKHHPWPRWKTGAFRPSRLTASGAVKGRCWSQEVASCWSPSHGNEGKADGAGARSLTRPVADLPWETRGVFSQWGWGSPTSRRPSALAATSRTRKPRPPAFPPSPAESHLVNTRNFQRSPWFRRGTFKIRKSYLPLTENIAQESKARAKRVETGPGGLGVGMCWEAPLPSAHTDPLPPARLPLAGEPRSYSSREQHESGVAHPPPRTKKNNNKKTHIHPISPSLFLHIPTHFTCFYAGFLINSFQREPWSQRQKHNINDPQTIRGCSLLPYFFPERLSAC